MDGLFVIDVGVVNGFAGGWVPSVCRRASPLCPVILAYTRRKVCSAPRDPPPVKKKGGAGLAYLLLRKRTNHWGIEASLRGPEDDRRQRRTMLTHTHMRKRTHTRTHPQGRSDRPNNSPTHPPPTSTNTKTQRTEREQVMRCARTASVAKIWPANSSAARRSMLGSCSVGWWCVCVVGWFRRERNNVWWPLDGLMRA